MRVLRTVLGDVVEADIDRILPHEHLLCDFSPVTHERNHVLNNPEFAIHELSTLNEDVPPRNGAKHVLVEVTLRDLGRDPEGLRRIANDADVHVVMGTGWYLEPYYPAEVYQSSTRELADGMISDLTEGILLTDGSRIRAGMIGELGTHGAHISPAEERVLRAAAKASLATDAPITTHAFMYPTGIGQLDILLEEKVDPSRVAIGHIDTFLDFKYHKALLERGCYLQFDTCGREHLMPDSLRVEMILRLLDAGAKERILLSSDQCFRSDLKMNGGPGYSWSIGGFCELLRGKGVGEDAIECFTRTNPLDLFSTGFPSA